MLFVFLNLLLSLANADPLHHTCEDTADRAAESTFFSNVDQALQTLRNTTASSGFATTVAGTYNHNVTALALCRGTVTLSDCQSCIDVAASEIRSVCPNQTAAQVWYSLCMLRYSADYFLNETDIDISFISPYGREAADPDAYDVKVGKLMHNLSSTAGASGKRYAVGRTIAPENHTIYGYADCTRDSHGDECQRCILTATSSCCEGAYWGGWVATPTCSIQFDVDPLQDDWLKFPYINTDATAAPAPEQAVVAAADHGRRGSLLAIKISISLGVQIFVLTAAVLWFSKKRKEKEKANQEIAEEDGDEEITREGICNRSFIFDLQVLVAATDGFSLANRLGAGGFGTVYKGRMGNGEEIAVKKLAAGSTQGREEFSNEVRLLLKLEHRNLVRLLGCCIEGENRMLVYEYLPNKSLDYLLFDKSKSALLAWPVRYNIIMGVARGLLYLHEDSQLKIIHRDIKASNILLDEWMNPKISDFGLAKLFKDEQTHGRTRRIAGTFGYMAPEYAIRGVVSAKIDVFSFGVLILEIISGRKSFDLQYDEPSRELLKLAWRLEQGERLMELVDTTIGCFPQDHVLKCIRVGLLCCQKSIQDRPSMSCAVLMLSEDSVTIPTTKRLGYQDTQDSIEHHNSVTFSAKDESLSKNSISCSLPIGRGMGLMRLNHKMLAC